MECHYYDEEEELRRAIGESLQEAVPISYKSKLDSLYEELQRSAKRARHTYEVSENSRYNTRDDTTNLCQVHIVSTLLVFVTASTLAALYRTSKYMGLLIERSIKTRPITSLRVESYALFSDLHKRESLGPLFTQIVKTLNTVRFKVRHSKTFPSVDKTLFAQPVMSHLILNVTHMDDMRWYMKYFNELFSGMKKVTVYHEMDHTGLHSTTLIYYRNAYAVSDRNRLYEYPVSDMDGALFNALTNV